MKNRHVIKRFLDWNDNRTGEQENAEIRCHLEECDDCRRYFDKMTKLMEGVGSGALPHLAPDPFLPARIRANEKRPDRRTSPRPALGRLAASVMGASVVVAAVAGVTIGTGLSSRADAGEKTDAIVEAYYEAFSQDEFVPEWDDVLETEEEDES